MSNIGGEMRSMAAKESVRNIPGGELLSCLGNATFWNGSLSLLNKK